MLTLSDEGRVGVNSIKKGRRIFPEEGRTYSRLVAVGMEKSGWFGEFGRHDGQDWVMGGFDRMTCMPGCLGFI